MKKLHKIIAASLLASATTMGSSVILAESPLTGNIGVTSNYMWRGQTQTGDLSAVSGGVDYATDFGLYAGTWVSDLGGAANGQEQDLYVGYGFDAGPVSLDAGFISYLNTPLGSASSSEVYVNASYSMFSAGVAVDAANKNTYISLGAEFEVKKDLSAGLTIGSNDANGTTYTHTTLNLSKGDFAVAVDKTDQAGAAGNVRFTVSWGQSFDL